MVAHEGPGGVFLGSRAPQRATPLAHEDNDCLGRLHRRRSGHSTEAAVSGVHLKGGAVVILPPVGARSHLEVADVHGGMSMATFRSSLSPGSPGVSRGRQRCRPW
jgi:hypothetical protein